MLFVCCFYVLSDFTHILCSESDEMSSEEGEIRPSCSHARRVLGDFTIMSPDVLSKQLDVEKDNT